MSSKTDSDDEEFQAWLEHPVTRALQDTLRRWIRQREAEWRSGAFISSDGDWASAMNNARAVAECDICDVILRLEAKDLQQSEDGE